MFWKVSLQKYEKFLLIRFSLFSRRAIPFIIAVNDGVLQSDADTNKYENLLEDNLSYEKVAALAIGAFLMLATDGPLITSRLSGMTAIAGTMILAVACFYIGNLIVKAIGRIRR